MTQVAVRNEHCVERLFACTGCKIHLPLRQARVDELAQIWECANCGTRHLAVFDKTARQSISHNCLQVVEGR